MKTHILAGIIMAGALAASVAQAATPLSTESVEALYSGLNTTEVQQIHRMSELQAMGHKSTCAWHEAESEATDPVIAAYLDKEEAKFLGEKDYLAAANFNFEC